MQTSARDYTIGNMLQLCSGRLLFRVLCVSMHLDKDIQCRQVVGVMQVMPWYEAASLCRHKFIEKHFSVSGDKRPSAACRTRCDFCHPQEDVCEPGNGKQNLRFYACELIFDIFHMLVGI
jgi:hypothetical protein